ncbi:uncharacterized protein K460DRAFT_190835 [Cucurbitaria berberidis CBS 394.84]|uniref:Uncharacterized protein n=1 Tax=Cucurbitaria berberidis CBS 394.84 TaxID=1168544 RepID=A0A9P4L3R9_9PLEO|nr:uncharacterized protein K460DRAFT_190835 [Cucurbitaria berberidis CBS 394.84]KAF1840680.1 hypothetical protein K460DRAFT_190835 [Cucurbitaria berberidis CBS 394.84]
MRKAAGGAQHRGNISTSTQCTRFHNCLFFFLYSFVGRHLCLSWKLLVQHAVVSCSCHSFLLVYAIARFPPPPNTPALDHTHSLPPSTLLPHSYTTPNHTTSHLTPLPIKLSSLLSFPSFSIRVGNERAYQKGIYYIIPKTSASRLKVSFPY